MKRLLVCGSALFCAAALFAAKETVTVSTVDDLIGEIRRLQGSGSTIQLAAKDYYLPTEAMHTNDTSNGQGLSSLRLENLKLIGLGAKPSDVKLIGNGANRVLSGSSSGGSRIARRSTAAERRMPGWKSVAFAEAGMLSPQYFNLLAREAGAYVATDRPGVEIDVNGDFLSLHCTIPGRYAIRLPRRTEVVNLKTGAVLGERETLDLEVTAGETRWYALR